jgi:hypothetical protein
LPTTIAVAELLERSAGPAQVTDLKLLGTAKNRYECVVSDGQDSVAGMTTTDTAKQVADGAIRDGSLIRLTDYACNLVGTAHKLILAGAGLFSSQPPATMHAGPARQRDHIRALRRVRAAG